ncbi:hypothetical protein PV773_06355 [Mesorhizobium sp. CC13]|uniref:hypothetical protein n=1 Tax=Mesorhizobium sp. CC13 TaxID=3029194 RepID=UPI003262FC6C
MTQEMDDTAGLILTAAELRFMFVVDADAFSALCRPALADRAPASRLSIWYRARRSFARPLEITKVPQ